MSLNVAEKTRTTKLFFQLKKVIESASSARSMGKVVSAQGALIQATIVDAKVGQLCYLVFSENQKYKAEVVNFNKNTAYLMPLQEHPPLDSSVLVEATESTVACPETISTLGRVVDFSCSPLDGLGPMPYSEKKRPVTAPVTNAMKRRFIKERLHTGVRAIDGLLSVGKGQRLGIFAGSGVGKSTLLSIIARNSAATVNIVCLVGERGREVKEFIHNHLGPNGMEKTVVVVATAGEPALARVRAVSMAITLAEFYRDIGNDVLLLVDSITRLAMAQREVGILLGEPPTSRSYTPSVFSSIASLVERGGNGKGGTITAFYTVLVEGDDFDEPVSDAVRGMLDGHIMLSRKYAERGHFPAIDIPSSLSRLMPDIVRDENLQRASRMRACLAAYKEAEELIKVGAYAAGSDAMVDEALTKNFEITNFLQQTVTDCDSLDVVDQKMLAIFP